MGIGGSCTCLRKQAGQERLRRRRGQGVPSGRGPLGLARAFPSAAVLPPVEAWGCWWLVAVVRVVWGEGQEAASSGIGHTRYLMDLRGVRR